MAFPFVAERKLGELGAVNLKPFSYREKCRDSWYYDVFPIQEFPAYIDSTALAIIGGGHLIHFSRLMGSNYGPTDAQVPHPTGFWWVPAMACRAAGIPVALNAVSVDEWIPAWAHSLMKSFVESLDYIAVRDRSSQARLRHFSVSNKEIHVVPDSIFSIPDLVTPGNTSSEYEKFRAETGLNKDYIVVQPSFGLRHYYAQIEDLASQALGSGLDVLELPIFSEMVDPVGYYRNLPQIKRVPQWPSPMLLAELIANSRAVVGLSLHLSIVASAYGIPVYRPAYSQASKFSTLDGLPNIITLESSPKLEVLDGQLFDLSIAAEKREQLNSHWRTVYELGDKKSIREPLWGWDQILETPNMFRRGAGMKDRLQTLSRELVRRRQLAALSIRSRIHLR